MPNNRQRQTPQNTSYVVKVETVQAPLSFSAQLLKEPVGLASLIVAISAVLISVQQGCQTRTHNELSVMPRIVVSGFYHTGKHAGIGFINSGLGPAEIREFAVLVDRKPVSSWKEALQALDIPLTGTTKNSSPVPGDFVRVSDIKPAIDSETILIGIRDEPERVQKLTEALTRIEVRITYCSLYRQCWKVTNSSVEHRAVPYPKDVNPTFFSEL
jgi:hypothetical protein